jgi:hypothetical protein
MASARRSEIGQGEATNHAREVVEASLAHRLPDKAEAAYARGDLFVKRRKLMQEWTDFLARPAADVVELPPAGEREAMGAAQVAPFLF